MMILKTGRGATLARAAVTATLAMAAVGAFATTSQAATSSMTAFPASGTPSGQATITLTLAAPTAANNNKFTSGNVGVQFQYAATPSSATCASTGAGVGFLGETALAGSAGVVTVLPTNVRFLASNKVSVKVPNLSGGPTTWIACAYGIPATVDGTPANAPVTTYDITTAGVTTALGKATYTVSTPSSVTSMAPTSGPALGGQTVTVTGTGFPTGAITTANPLTATLGGVTVTGVQTIDATHFSFITPAHSASTSQTLVVTSSTGTSAAGGTYAFINGIEVQPDFVQYNTSADLDISGAGFTALTFDTTSNGADTGAAALLSHTLGTNSNKPHVYLVRGAYNATNLDATHDKLLGQSAECVNVAVVSDTELICTLNGAKSVTTDAAGAYTYAATPLARNAYTVTVVNDGEAVAPTFKTVLSSGATVTVADF